MSLRGRRWLAALCGGLAVTAVQAQDDTPDLDFLEYLGTWQESDDEWLAVAEWEGQPDAGQDRPDVPGADEDTEDDAEDPD